MNPSIAKVSVVHCAGSRRAWSGVVLCLGLIALNVRSSGRDWPNWRGPNRDGISQETNWSAQASEQGLREIWRFSIGSGYSAVSTSHGKLYASGNSNETDTVWCLEPATGREIWRYSYPCRTSIRNERFGPAASPVVEEGRVYTLSLEGELFCFSADSGKVLWSKRVARETGAQPPPWGFSGSPLISGDLLILNMGSAGTAIEKASGRIAWTSGKAPSGYASPVAFNFDGRKQVTILGADALVCVNPTDGKELWRHPWRTEYGINVADPVISGDKAFISSNYGKGCGLVQFGGGEPRMVWQNHNLHAHFTTPVLIDGFLYGIDGEADAAAGTQSLRCISLSTGEVQWSKPLPAIASLIAAGKKLILLTGSGELMTVAASPGKCDVLSRVQVMGGRCWTPPVLSDAKLYCRNAQGLLVCLDVGVHGPASKGALAEFPFEGDEGPIFVQAKINHAGPFRFILDTGAYESLVDTRAATKAGLRLEGGQQIGGAGGSETGTSVRDIKLSLPGFEFESAQMDALPLDALSARHGLEIDGILGSELFSRNVVEIDYEKKAIRLYDPGRFSYQGNGERIRIDIERNVPHARGRLELPGLEPIEGEFTIDTGSSASLILTPVFITEHDLLKRVSKQILTYGRGVGGEVAMTVSRAKALQLGAISLTNCLTLLPERGQFGGPTGNVGSRLLRRCRVIFDYVHQVMILEPNNLFSVPEEFDMSGLAFVAESGRFRVEHVLPNSPAAEAGIQPGDLIEGVNERPTVGMDIAELRALFRRADSEYDLTFRRGGESNKSHLKLRRLI